MPMTDAERAMLKPAMEAMQEARRRARARGLTDEEIGREEDDDDSQFWDDVRAYAAEWHARKETH